MVDSHGIDDHGPGPDHQGDDHGLPALPFEDDPPLIVQPEEPAPAPIGDDLTPGDPLDPIAPRPGWPTVLPGLDLDLDLDVDLAQSGPGPDDTGPSDPDQMAPGPAAEARGEPILLDVDEPLEARAGFGSDSGEHDDLGGYSDAIADADTDAEGGDPSEPQPTDVEVMLPLDDSAGLEPYVVPDGNGLLDDVVVAAGLGSIGAATLLPAMRRLRRPTPPDTVALLDSLGIDARVEHGDLATLEERLADGGAVMLATDGSAGVDAERVLHLRRIDRQAGRMHVTDAGGQARSVPLERFESAWADSANQLVVAAGDDGAVALLPVVIDGADLASGR